MKRGTPPPRGREINEEDLRQWKSTFLCFQVVVTGVVPQPLRLGVPVTGHSSKDSPSHYPDPPVVDCS